MSPSSGLTAFTGLIHLARRLTSYPLSRASFTVARSQYSVASHSILSTLMLRSLRISSRLLAGLPLTNSFHPNPLYESTSASNHL